LKPTVGFKLPWAGVTPAPSEKKSQNGEDAILLKGSFLGMGGREFTSPVIFTGEEAGGRSRR
jgi:hypothetical protein